MKQLFVAGKLYALRPTIGTWVVNSSGCFYRHSDPFNIRRIQIFPTNTIIMCLNTSSKDIIVDIKFVLNTKQIKISKQYYDIARQILHFKNDWELL